MRTEKEMFDLILSIANEDERIRAVYINGSRANPNVEKDQYQEYDIVYVVTETESFLEDKTWISKFGDIAIVQEPDSNDLGWGVNADYSRAYTWLMLFKDGTRIDLHIEIKEETDKAYISDSLTIPLLDKDNILPQIPASSDKGYLVKKPSKSKYDGCCNEFWWCLNNVAKGLVRDQIPYVSRMYNEIVHVELHKMLEWYVGINTDFSVSVGMWGKYFKKYLPVKSYESYIKTFLNYEDPWKSIFTACELFRTVAKAVGKHLGYDYKQSDDDNMMIYLINMKNK